MKFSSKSVDFATCHATKHTCYFSEHCEHGLPNSALASVLARVRSRIFGVYLLCC